MVSDVRRMEAALGLPEKRLLPAELPCQKKLGKSVVAARDLPVSTTLSPTDLAIKVVFLIFSF